MLKFQSRLVLNTLHKGACVQMSSTGSVNGHCGTGAMLVRNHAGMSALHRPSALHADAWQLVGPSCWNGTFQLLTYMLTVQALLSAQADPIRAGILLVWGMRAHVESQAGDGQHAWL